jgi:DNA-binding CsgD family transcriptional regulator
MEAVEYARLVLITINAFAFLALLIMSMRMARREEDPWLRRLWIIIAAASGAFVVGSFQRIALQAVAVGWLPESIWVIAVGDLQLIQSGIVFALAVIAFVTLKRLAASAGVADRLSRSLLDRVGHVDARTLNLTAREKEVLSLIGEGVTKDSELSAELNIAASTVQSHVKSLLRKTGLHRRSDLVAVAILVHRRDSRPLGGPRAHVGQA